MQHVGYRKNGLTALKGAHSEHSHAAIILQQVIRQLHLKTWSKLKQYVDFDDIANWATAVAQLSKNYIVFLDNMLMMKRLQILQQLLGESVKNECVFETAKMNQHVVFERITNCPTAVGQLP
jgi:hypothetical protein